MPPPAGLAYLLPRKAFGLPRISDQTTAERMEGKALRTVLFGAAEGAAALEVTLFFVPSMIPRPSVSPMPSV